MSERYQLPRSTSGMNHCVQDCSGPAAMSQYRDLDATKRDRFELLSAYLDGEVSPEERRLVTVWLDQDPEAQCLYRRLLQLRQGFQGLSPEYWQTTPGNEAANQVFRKLNHRFRMTCMAGMTAAAVAVIGVFSGALHPMERIGWNTMSASSPDESLEIALDQPPILIPKPAMAPAGTLPMDSVLPGATAPADLNEASL